MIFAEGTDAECRRATVRRFPHSSPFEGHKTFLARFYVDTLQCWV